MENEFKGSKKLVCDLKNNKVLNDNGVIIIANVNDFDGNAKYDTLLFSKAPEMLEMLKAVKQGIEILLDNDNFNDEVIKTFMESILPNIHTQLLNQIKEATTI